MGPPIQAGDRLVVVQRVSRWLPQTATWLYTQVDFLPPDVESHVVCEATLNLDQFPHPHVHSLAAQPRWRAVWDKGVRKLGARSHLRFTVDVARRAGAAVLHSHFGDTGWADVGAARAAGLKHVVTFYGLDVIYLPDLEHPLYAVQRAGVGKGELTVKMRDGKLTDFGAVADSKAAEFTGALTAGLKSIAEALKTQREAELLRAKAEAARERAELAGQLERFADELSQAESTPPGFGKAAVERLSDGLKSAAAKLRDPALHGNEEQVAEALEARVRDLDRVEAPVLKRELRRIIGRLRAAARVAAAIASTFELYEFRMKDGQTTLVRVAGPE